MLFRNEDIIKYAFCMIIGLVIGTIGKSTHMPLIPLLLLGVAASALFLWLWDVYIDSV